MTSPKGGPLRGAVSLTQEQYDMYCAARVERDFLAARVDDLSAAIINCVDSGTVDGQGAAYLKRLATEAKEALRGK